MGAGFGVLITVETGVGDGATNGVGVATAGDDAGTGPHANATKTAMLIPRATGAGILSSLSVIQRSGSHIMGDCGSEWQETCQIEVAALLSHLSQL